MPSEQSRRRREADALLLSEGPQDWESLVRLMAQFVSPGRAACAVARSRKTESNPKHRDGHMVGARKVARETVSSALRHKWMVLPDGRISHRDWTGEAVAASAATAEVAFTIPTMEILIGHQRLLKATDWERAAIVAAFVTLDGTPGPKRSATSSRSLTAPEFAALGIVGLKSKDTVRQYVKAWGDRPRPSPGDVVALPSAPFPRAHRKDRTPPTAHTGRTHAMSTLDAARKAVDGDEYDFMVEAYAVGGSAALTRLVEAANRVLRESGSAPLHAVRHEAS